jgi:TP901 family phage tail tape measure protein
MSLSVLAAGVTITGKDQVSPVLGKIGRSFSALQRQGAALRQGLSQVAGGVSRLATIVGTGLGVVMAYGANQAANFEQQFSVVKSVLQKSGPDVDALEKKLKALGATTAYSATQAAEGSEFLSRAGFTAREQMDALAGTLNAAAAEAIPLGTAANIVANNVRGFGLEASAATMVADVLAQTSAKTNTNMIQLGEALKYVAPEARALNVDIKDTSFVLGVLANAGLQGSIGGTAFKNMLMKLGRPSDQMKKKLVELGISFADTNGDMLPIVQVVKNIAANMHKLQGNLAKTGFLTDFLGIRGKAAAQNLLGAFETMGSAGFEDLQNQIRNSAGAAERMATVRLDNFKGSVTLLQSALEGLAIEIFTGNLKGAKTAVDWLASAISVVVIGLQDTEKILAGGTTPELDKLREKLGNTTDTLIQIAAGIKDGLEMLGQLGDKLQFVRDRMNTAFGENSDGARGIAKWMVVLAPMLVGFAALALVAALFLGPLAAIGSGLLIAAKAIMILAAIGVVAFVLFKNAIIATQRSGQDFEMRFREIMTNAKVFIEGFIQGFKNNFGKIQEGLDVIELAFVDFMGALGPIFETFGALFDEASGHGLSYGELLATSISWVIKAFGFLLQIVGAVAGFFITNFVAPAISGVAQIYTGFMDMISGARSFGDAMKSVFKGIGLLVSNTFLAPLKAALAVMIQIASSLGFKEKGIGGGGLTALKALRDNLQGKAGTALGVDKKDQTKWSKDAELEHVKKSQDAKNSARIEANKPPTVNVEAPKASDVKATINSNLNVDGKAFNVASSASKFELSERMGRVSNPRTSGQIIMNGDLPSGAR